MDIRGYGKVVNGIIDFNFKSNFAIVAGSARGELSIDDDNFSNEGYVSVFDTAELDTDEWNRAMINFIEETIENGYVEIFLMDSEEGNDFEGEWFLSDWSGRKIDDLILDIKKRIMYEIIGIIDEFY